MSNNKEILLGTKLGWTYTFAANDAFPIEANKIFSTLTDATNYVKSNPTAYAGNVISVIYDDTVENNGVYFVKSVGANGELVKVGSVVDWNAQEGESGYIANKPFYFKITETDYVHTAELEYDYSSSISISGYNNYFKIYIENIGSTFIYLPNGIPTYNYDKDVQEYYTEKMTFEVNDFTFTIYSNGGGDSVMDILWSHNDWGGTTDPINIEIIECSVDSKKLSEVYIPDTVLKTTPQVLSDADKNQVKENLGISNPDWNAQEGEAGYIENRPFNLVIQNIDFELYDDKAYAYISGIYDYDGFYILDKPVQFNGNYNFTIDYLEGFEQYNGITIELQSSGDIYVTPNYIDTYVGDTVEGFVDYCNRNIKAFKIKVIDTLFIPDTVLKTTPQTLSDKDKNQLLDNLGIANLPFSGGESENSAVLKGGNNKVTNANEVALGKYNESNNDTMFSIGIGTSDTDRKNAFEVKGNGDIYFNDIKFELVEDTDDEVNNVWNEIIGTSM
jgi:hypothetical protein